MTCTCCGLNHPDVRAVIPSQPLCGYCVEWCDRTQCKRVWRARTGTRPVTINPNPTEAT